MSGPQSFGNFERAGFFFARGISMLWFKHYSDASTSVKINEIIDELGLDGYARWFLLLELLASKFDGDSTDFQIHFNELSSKTRVKFKRKLDNFLQLLSKSCLIKLEIHSKVYKIGCPILLDLQSRDFKTARSKRSNCAPKSKIKNKIKNKDKDKEVEIKSALKKRKINFAIEPQIISDIWVSFFPSKNFKGITAERKTKIKTFEKKVGFKTEQEWRFYFETISKSDFLTGKRSNFKVTFDWILKPANAIKIIEGNYTNNYEEKQKTQSKFEQAKNIAWQNIQNIGEEDHVEV